MATGATDWETLRSRSRSKSNVKDSDGSAKFKKHKKVRFSIDIDHGKVHHSARYNKDLLFDFDKFKKVGTK